MNEHRYAGGKVLGLLADSHGRADITRIAVDRLIRAGADVLIHLGDVCGDAVLDVLAGFRAHVVFGNCDPDWRTQAEYARSLGLHVDHPSGRLQVGNQSVAFAHGDNPAHERQAVSACADYFCHGHSHLVRDEKAGRTRIVNPGALFRAACYTVARLDPEAGRLEVLTVQRVPGCLNERPRS